MRGISRVALLTALVLFISSSSMSALAGKALAVSPELLSQPVVKIERGQAKSYHYRAVTRAAVRKKGLIRIGKHGWQCQGKRCTVSGPWPTPAVSACKALARQVGPIRSYGHNRRKLSSVQLKQCNAGIAAKPAMARSLVLPPPKAVARSKQALVRPGQVARSAKTLPPVLKINAAAKHKNGFTAATLPPPSVVKPGKPKGGFALKKSQSRSAPSVDDSLPHEKKMVTILTDIANKKESELGRETDVIHNIAKDGSGGRKASSSRRGGFAPVSPRTTTGGATSSSGRTGGGFAPLGVAGQATRRNALSPQQIASINLRKGYWQDYQRAMKAKRQRDEARARERMQRLSREAYLSGADCDDSDPQIHPGLLEVCDHKDNNCDGRVDEGTTILAYADVDGDGHGDGSTATEVCSSDIAAAQRRGEWLSTVGNDCDDGDPDRWHDCPTGGGAR